MVAVIALAAGFVARGVLPNRAPVDPMAVTGEFPIPVTPASDPRSGAVATQFVFEAPAAQSVALVGDFNGWVPTAAPLVRLRSGVWTVTVPLMPGRHVYAFLVDGARLEADPRAAAVVDAEILQAFQDTTAAVAEGGLSEQEARRILRLTESAALATRRIASGEAGTIGATPAVVNAVLDALSPLGVTHLDMPLTPQCSERVVHLSSAATAAAAASTYSRASPSACSSR